MIDAYNYYHNSLSQSMIDTCISIINSLSQSIIDACNTSKTFVGMENLPDLAASNKAQFVNGATCSQCDIKLSRTQ